MECVGAATYLAGEGEDMQFASREEEIDYLIEEAEQDRVELIELLAKIELPKNRELTGGIL